MKEKYKKNWPGIGLLVVGMIVLVAGLTIGLFRELEIPRHWIPATVGAALILAGIIVRGMKNVYDRDVPQNKIE